MAATCPECKATLDDPSKPCEWCGHTSNTSASAQPAATAAAPAKEVDTAPPPANYEEHAKEPAAVAMPKNEPPRFPAKPAPAKPAAAAAAPRPTARAPEPFTTPVTDLRAAAKAPEPFTKPKGPRLIPKEPDPISAAPPPPPPPSLPPPPVPPARAAAAAPAVTPKAAAVASKAAATAASSTREQILDGGDLESPVALELDMGDRASAEPAVYRGAAIATPVGRGQVPEGPELDPAEVRMVARFGVTPDAWWSTPAYVRHVRARQTELDKELAGAEDQYLTTKGALDDALVSIGQRAIAETRNTPRARGPYLKALERLTKRETDLKAVDAGVYEESERHREELRSLFERIEETKAKLAAGKTKELAADLLALQQERDATERNAKMPAKARDPEVEKARGAFRMTVADLAQFVLDDRAMFGEDYEEPRARIARLRNACDAAEKKVLLHRAAQSAFDEKALATGVRVTYGAVGLAVLSLVILVLAFK